jgi:hypothetical protein
MVLHSGRAVWGMNRLHLLESWDHGFQSHSRHAYLCMRLFCGYVACMSVAALRWADHSSKESCRLYKEDYETEEEARAQQRALENEKWKMDEMVLHITCLVMFLPVWTESVLIVGDEMPGHLVLQILLP